MNLVTNPWIPVITMQGKPDFAGLMQVFTEGEKYADLSVRPHERVALMRLLICIAQAALDGPADKEDWKESPRKLPRAAKAYLDKWGNSFGLFDEQRPFLQIAGLVPANDKVDRKRPKANSVNDETLTSISKLNIALATGVNTTLFDHQANSSDKRSFEEKEVALSLITFLNFSASGRIGIAKWGGDVSPGNGASFPGPCIDKLALHTFLRGKTVFNTITTNLLTKGIVGRHFGSDDAWGKPIWEKFPRSFQDNESIQNATNTYLGRLVPLTRALRIRASQNDMLLSNGPKFPLLKEGNYETSATIRINKDNERTLLKVTDRAIWRELPAIITKASGEANAAHGPRVLENELCNDFDVWVGGMEWSTKGGYAGTVEAVYNISRKMLTDAGRSLYEEGVSAAEWLSYSLGLAIESYRRNIDRDWDQRVEKAGKDRNKLKARLHSLASRAYWTAIEKNRHLLMAHVEAYGTDQLVPTCEAWQKALHKAARDSYIMACGQETPRQIRAFALGWKKLFAPKSPVEEEQTEVQNTDGGEE